MSIVTSVVLTVYSHGDDEAEDLPLATEAALTESGSPFGAWPGQRFNHVDTSKHRGPKAFVGDVYMAGFNYANPRELLSWLRGLDWGRHAGVIAVINYEYWDDTPWRVFTVAPWVDGETPEDDDFSPDPQGELKLATEWKAEQ